MGASSPGKCRSPQTAPRLWRPYLGSIEPSRSPEVVLDAFRASLTGPESCLLQLRPCVHKFQRAPDRPKCDAAAARLPSRHHIRTIRATGRSANRDGPLVQPAAADPIRMGQMQQVDDETTIGRCAAPSGRIRVISGSLTSSLARSWTPATHMLTAGPTSLPIPAWQFHFRIRIRIRTVTQ